MRADELYKFLDGTLKTVRDELHHQVLDFRLGYNKEMSRRKWTAIDKRRSELMVELIDKQMRERRIIRNLKRLVGARELEMDYRLMTHTTELALEQTQQGVSDEVLVIIEGVEERKRIVRIKGEKKEALHTLSRHGPSDAMHNPPQLLKIVDIEKVAISSNLRSLKPNVHY
ncbi:hypothetical protein Tco_0921342 [Tanacetum coccineum]